MEKEYLHSEERTTPAAPEEDLAYYRALLDDAETAAPEQDRDGGEASFDRLSRPLARVGAGEIRAKGTAAGVSEGTLLLGALGWTLSLMEGAARTAIAFASPDAALSRALPAVCDCRDDRPVDEYLRELERQTAESRAHSADVSGEPGLKPDVCFAWETRLSESEGAAYELCIVLRRERDSYLLDVTYRADHYSREMTEALAQNFEQALSELLKRETMAQLQAASPEQLALLDGFNETAADYDRRDVVSQFRAQAARVPDNIAVIFNELRLTYRETDERSERIAAYLRDHGVGAGNVVSVLILRCEYMALASLGVLKSGAAYQPLDPSYPPERLSFMVEDAGAKLLIADRTLMDCLPDNKLPVLYLDEIPALPAAEGTLPAPEPESLFILLYTSGTTGVPKGVMLEHRNLAAFAAWYRRYYELTETCRVSAYASYGFDACMMDLYPALTSGAAVVIVPEETRLDLPALERYFEANGVTHSFMTTQVGRQFAQVYQGSTLRHLSVGGERLVPVLPNGTFAFHNGYGPTECTIFATAYPVRELMHRLPIGKPLDNVRLYVVDKAGRRLPVGGVGELWIAGHQVGRGYLNRPEKTAETFIPNPFTDEPGYERVYRTGDVARYLPDGNVDFIGRNDAQVKIRGFRVELGEVEEVVRSFPGIKDATVQAFDDPAGGKMIAAYVVADAPVDVPAMEAFIRERKPPYMVPAATMQLDSIPLNQNQKVNKRALPKPEPKARAGRAEGPAAPLNILERALGDLLSEIVGTDEFGVTDNFGELGLTSISAIHFASTVYQRYGVSLKVRELVANGSIQSVENEILSVLLGGGAGKTDGAEKPESGAAEAKKTERSCRLSFAQQGVYADCQADPESVRYNLPFALRFPEGTGAAELEAAVRKVVAAHPYLLCRFTANGADEIVQEPIPDFTLDIPTVSVSAAELDERKRAFVRPFDLAAGPVIRFEIVESDALWLLADLHHLVSDGASVDLFFTQLASALDGAEIERETYDYYDFVAEEHLEAEAEDFFASQLAAVEDAACPIPDVFEENLPHTEKSVSVPTDFSTVKALSQRCGVTPAAAYLAASALTVGRYVCEDTVAMATISSGRSNLKISGTMGMFVNTLPIVTVLDHKEKAEDFLRRAAKTFSDTITYENYPFARIAAKYDFRPAVSYAYQLGVLNEYRTKRGAVAMEELRSDVAKIPVSIFIEGTEDAACIRIAYDAAMYSEAMMRGLAESIENAARGLARGGTLSDVSLTDEAQWKTLDGFNPAWDLNYDKADTAVSVFRRRAKEQPEKIAAFFRDKRYTYRELDELTDALAAKLYRRACEATGKTKLAEEVAALLLPRDENVFILPLAAVKAGLAYEPLDPSYPKERLNFMVKDAGACLLVTEDSLLGAIDEYGGTVLTVRELYETEPAAETPAEPSPEDLFVMLYTSGSTGTPKGCQIEHRNIVAFAHGVGNDFCTKNDVTGAYASFGFDVNMEDVFCTLLNGGTICLIPEDVRMDLGALAAYFDEYGVTALLLTTQVGVQFLQNYPRLKTLRLLIMGGEKLPAVDPSRLSYTISNGYGPTENCCGVSLFPIRAWEPNIPIGKPIPTVHGFVLDKTGHRLPAGAAGEFCLAGPQVTRGYLNRPDKTAEAYEPCPFNEFRMYHTGDIVRYRQNGDVEFVGRKDGQVKIRGFRIETKEVEAVIRGFDGVRDVTVQPYDYEGGGKYLAAFVVGDAPVDFDRLRAYIKEQKPAYMVPAALMQIEKIPLTVNQKVDKKALPKPELQKAAYVAPEGKTEEDLCAVFAGVLGVERMGAEDDFFETGGSSILAMKVVIAAGKAGYRIVYNDVFKYTTPRAMARFLGGGAQTEKTAPAPAAEADARTVPEIGRDGYDYARIHALLARNTLDAFRNGERLPLGDVLLLGGTGYLGCHVLRELIERHGESRLYCFVRPGKEESGEQRLKNTLRGYFGEDCAPLFGSRITVLEGDATDPDALRAFRAPGKGMTVVNCAASVKHFAKGNEIERANVDSVRNLAAWCEENGARLVHISTCSVAGCRENGMPPETWRLDEHRLFNGQEIDSNQYIHSKFMAERHIYEEMLEHGLRAKVVRVANLAPRAEDGAFQLNYRTNNYMNSLRAYATLGAIPYDALDEPTEFSPIDFVARGVLALAETPEDCACFMLLNPHRPLLGDVMRELGALGHPVRGTENEEFERVLREALADEEKSEAVGSLIAYDSNSDIREIGPEGIDNAHTLRVLERLGVSFPETGTAYIRRFLEKLERKEFF